MVDQIMHGALFQQTITAYTNAVYHTTVWNVTEWKKVNVSNWAKQEKWVNYRCGLIFHKDRFHICVQREGCNWRRTEMLPKHKEKEN